MIYVRPPLVPEARADQTALLEVMLPQVRERLRAAALGLGVLTASSIVRSDALDTPHKVAALGLLEVAALNARKRPDRRDRALALIGQVGEACHILNLAL